MQCPICNSKNLKVTDSRDILNENQQKRRRKCEDCGYKFVTTEILSESMASVIKSDKTIESFDLNKLKGSLYNVYKPYIEEKRISEIISLVNNSIGKGIQNIKLSIKTSEIEDIVLSELKKDNSFVFLKYLLTYKSSVTKIEDIKKSYDRY